MGASDVQLHVAHAKGSRLQEWIKTNGLQGGEKVRYTLDFEENRGKGYAADWELVEPPFLPNSRSRSRGGARTRRSPSYGQTRSRKSPSRGRKSRRSPSYGRGRKSPSYG